MPLKSINHWIYFSISVFNVFSSTFSQYAYVVKHFYNPCELCLVVPWICWLNPLLKVKPFRKRCPGYNTKLQSDSEAPVLEPYLSPNFFHKYLECSSFCHISTANSAISTLHFLSGLFLLQLLLLGHHSVNHFQHMLSTLLATCSVNFYHCCLSISLNLRSHLYWSLVTSKKYTLHWSRCDFEFVCF